LNPGDKKDSLGLEQMSRFNMEGQQVATNTIIAPVEKIVYVNSNDSSVPTTNKVGNNYVNNMIEMVS
jgi:hypothetical protein